MNNEPTHTTCPTCGSLCIQLYNEGEQKKVSDDELWDEARYIILHSGSYYSVDVNESIDKLKVLFDITRKKISYEQYRMDRCKRSIT